MPVLPRRRRGIAQTPARASLVRHAGTLAAAANVTGMTLVAGLTQAITGGLTNWFSRRTNPQPAAVPGQ